MKRRREKEAEKKEKRSSVKFRNENEKLYLQGKSKVNQKVRNL